MSSQPAEMVTGPELSVVLPTRNEAENVGRVISHLTAALEGLTYELLFIDDSDDSTTVQLRHAAAVNPALRLVHRGPSERDGGLSTAVSLGMELARGRLICVMDADLQHPPETIRQMLEAERGGAELVVGSRYMEGGSARGLDGGVRRAVSRSASLLSQLLFAEARLSSDPLSGFFLCRRSLLQGIAFRPKGFKILLELLVCTQSPTVADVPLRFAPREAGTSKASITEGRMFLAHLLSLLWQVPGSARRWKYAAVGASGLLLFLGLLEVCGVLLGWVALAAWAVAFFASLAWNFGGNLRLTFADIQRDRYPLLRRYVSSAITAGGAQLVFFLGLTGTKLPLVFDGLIAAVVGMAVNALLSYQLVRCRRLAPPVTDDRLAAALRDVARAQRVTIVNGAGAAVSEAGTSSPRPLPALALSLASRAAETGTPGLWTEAPSDRAQPRRNIELTSLMLVPLGRTRPGQTAIFYRYAPQAFSNQDLEAALHLLERSRPGKAASPIQSETAGANL